MWFNIMLYYILFNYMNILQMYTGEEAVFAFSQI